jgi:hypothetical protein
MLDNLAILCLGGIVVLGLFCIVGIIAKWKGWE